MVVYCLYKKGNYTYALGLGQSERLHPMDLWNNSNIQSTLNSATFAIILCHVLLIRETS